jgi:hypothetical protein
MKMMSYLLLLLCLAPWSSQAVEQRGDCSRQCLLALQNQVLQGMLSHRAAGLPLASNARIVENGTVVAPGQGVWLQLQSVGARLDVADSEGRGVATFAYANDGQPALLMLRLALSGRAITEIEILTAHKGESGWFPRQEVSFWDPLYDSVLPPLLRSSRDQAARVADLYFEGIHEANGDIVPFDRSCDRYENARKVTNRQDNGYVAYSCAGGLSSIKPTHDRGLRERRYPIVDVERGLVVGIGFHESSPRGTSPYPADFDPLNFTNYPDTSEVTAGRATALPPRPQALYVADVFKIIAGKLRQNEVVMKNRPYGTRTGFSAGAVMPATQAARFEPRQQHLMVVYNNEVTGRDEDYRRWYASTHLPWVVGFPDVVSGQLYAKTEITGGVPQHPPRNYMILYRIDSSDIKTTYDGFKPAPAAEAPEPVDESSSYAISYRNYGYEVKGSAPRSHHGGTLKTYVFMVLDEPLAGREADFNSWYDNVHLADLLGTPGLVAAQRYILGDVQRPKTAAAPKYLAIYTLVTDDVLATFGELRARAKSFRPTDSVDATGSAHYTYEVLSVPVQHQGDLRKAP